MIASSSGASFVFGVASVSVDVVVAVVVVSKVDWFASSLLRVSVVSCGLLLLLLSLIIVALMSVLSLEVTLCWLLVLLACCCRCVKNGWSCLSVSVRLEMRQSSGHSVFFLTTEQ